MQTGEDLGLTTDEVDVLRAGIRQWGGPADLTEPIAHALGFEGVEDFFVQGQRVDERLDRGTPMSLTEWRRTLLATELVFVSDVVGAGIEWETTTGVRDTDTLRLLRSLQRKIVR